MRRIEKIGPLFALHFGRAKIKNLQMGRRGSLRTMTFKKTFLGGQTLQFDTAFCVCFLFNGRSRLF
jgi:hypothetical protein